MNSWNDKKAYVRISFSTAQTLYYRQDSAGSLIFVLNTQVDNYIYTGTEKELELFETFLQHRFDVVNL